MAVGSAPANGITIAYETHGDAAGEPLLLVMGLGAQLLAWDQGFLNHLVDRGYFVITFDNRDVGLSSWFDEAGPADFSAFFAGEPLRPAYLLGDLADDAAGLLDALGIASAHILGVSMGGMVAQEIAIRHPHRTRSLCSIMSTTGNPEVGQPTPEATASLLVPPVGSRDEAIEQGVMTWKVIGSPGFAFDEPAIRERAAAAYDRAYHPEGTGRQLVAILSSPDRTEALGRVTVPTLVLHGEADPLVTISGGRATAAAVPSAELRTYPGMGHDLPEALWPEFLDAITAHTAKVR